jgi:predicted deacylase
LKNPKGAATAATLLLLSAVLSAQDQPTFTVGTATAGRGHRATGFIEVPAGVDAGTRIPVILFHGAWPGPVLAVVSGAHGTEYASIIAVERLAERLDPAEVSGTVILVPLVNIASFEHKVPHVNPVDGKSMNRFYPGRADGSQTERAAFALTREVVDRADHLIDLHGGDLDESLRPYSYWTKTGNEKIDAVSREMVLAFGLDHIIIATDRPRDPAASRYLENTATTRGKPSIAAEAGHAGTVEPDDVEALVRGCQSVLRLFKIVPGAPSRIEHPVWFDAVKTVTSEHTGIFYPLVKRGSYVEAGEKVGYVTDYFGALLAEARASASGVVLYICAVPSMRKGDTIANIGVVAASRTP